MKKDFIIRLAILAVMLICCAVLAFAEIGIATAFNMTFNGLSYMDYIREFYAVPWHFATALAIMVIMIVLCCESIYRSYCTKN